VHAGDVVAGRYELLSEVAAGGGGRIYRARDILTEQAVALKVMLPLDPDASTRFHRESLLLARIQHPGLVRYLAHGLGPAGDPWLATEWLEGEDLHRRLSRRTDVPTRPRPSTPGLSGARQSPPAEGPSSPLPPGDPAALPLAREVTVLLRRLAGALAVLHGDGLLHRDVKPSNIFLVGGQLTQAKLLDLGAVRITEDEDRITRTGYVIGTPAYMSPEQVLGTGELTPATDVWALGCVAYECLSGERLFRGRNIEDTFERVVSDTPRSLAELAPATPPALVSLLHRMLDKDPSRRPPDGAALLEALAAIDVEPPDEVAAAIPSLGATERRVGCVVRAVPAVPHHPVSGTEAGLEEAGFRPDAGRGVWVAHMPAHASLTDQAHRAASVVCQLRELVSEWAFALRIEPIVLDEDRGEPSAADAELARSGPGEICLDARTAALLESRFTIEGTEGTLRLVAPRPVETARTLLGKRTRTVGRRRELAILGSTWAECSEERRARALLVTAPPGIGKSRLRWEFTESLRRSGDEHLLLSCQGDSLSAGSPFAMIGPALRRAAFVLDGEPGPSARAKVRALVERSMASPREAALVSAFLGELMGVPFDDGDHEALRAARKEPLLLAEQTRSAFVRWLGAEAERRPVLVVVEDLHWGDRPSVRLLDAALGTLRDSPLLVLALARPEVHHLFPSLWGGHPIDELRLEGLGRRACAELAQEVLAKEVQPARLDAMFERSGGNALYLEEILRAVNEGESLLPSALPDTVVGMVQSRLALLGPEPRRILRAASVFGEVFWEGGVRALIGESGSGYRLADWLEELCHRELVSRVQPARIPGEAEYRFRHALVRDGAYALLTTPDRVKAHGLAGTWLERSGEGDAFLLASHYELGEQPENAVRCHALAAEAALEGNDLEGALASAQRAQDLGAAGPALGALRALCATARYWQSRYREASEASGLALAAIPRGTEAWFQAAGTGIVSHARLGDHAAMERVFARVRDAKAAEGAEAAQLVSLCRGTFQLIFQGRFADADATLAQIAALRSAVDSLDALTEAQIRHVHGVRAAMVGDVGTFFVELEAAVAAFDRAGDVRNVSLERTTVGWCLVELGRFDEGIRALRANLAGCQELRAQQALTYAKVNLGYALERLPEHAAEADRLLAEAIAETSAVRNQRLEGWARGHLASLRLRQGDGARAEAEARQASELLRGSPSLCGWVEAVRSRALLRLGRVEPALAAAEGALAILDRVGGLLQGSSLPPLAWAEALHRAGQQDRARAAAEDARGRLLARAARLPEPSWRTSFLAIAEHAETQALAARLSR
jgi:serine/threonine protein kinase/tetratricopeptide (TPR) repeat protein